MTADRKIAQLARVLCVHCALLGKKWSPRSDVWPCPTLDHLQASAFQSRPLPQPLCSHFTPKPLSLPTLHGGPDD